MRFAACGAGSDGPGQAPGAKLDKVKVGAIGLTSDAGIYIAQERGYFNAAGLTVESMAFDTAAKMVPTLSAGQLDVGTGAPSAGLNNAAAQNLGPKIVPDKGTATGASSP